MTPLALTSPIRARHCSDREEKRPLGEWRALRAAHPVAFSSLSLQCAEMGQVGARRVRLGSGSASCRENCAVVVSCQLGQVREGGLVGGPGATRGPRVIVGAF